MDNIAQIITLSHQLQYEKTKTTAASIHTFNLIKELYGMFYKDAVKYYKQVRALDKKLKSIQNSIVAELEKAYPLAYIVPSSSFTAKCNVLSESDIDIYIYYIKPIDDKSLIDLKFVKKESPSIKYQLFCKTVDNIPIEIKVRNYKEAQTIRKLHAYLDTKLSTNDKIFITYIKSQLVNNRPAYKAFKTLVFNYCLYNIKVNTLI
jgi:hypothetical protein